MNAVLLAVIVMLVLSVLRMHVVLALLFGAIVGGLVGDLGVTATLESFSEGMKNGASIALSYVLLGSFAAAIAHSGVPNALAGMVIKRLDGAGQDQAASAEKMVRWGLLGALVIMAIFSQNLIPIHIAFIPILVPPLLGLATRLQIDRRAMACAMTFGLVTTYMFLPVGFGSIFLNDILLKNIGDSGMDVSDVNVMAAMAIPALGMVAGLAIALFYSYRKPRSYQGEGPAASVMDTTVVMDEAGDTHGQPLPTAEATLRDPNVATTSAPAPKATTADSFVPMNAAVAAIAVMVAFSVQLMTDSMLIGALLGFIVFVLGRVVRWGEMDRVFNKGLSLMAGIGFIMITAQGFAQVMKDTGQIEPLVTAVSDLFGQNMALAALAMLVVGLVITMGIGSSFSTLPIIAAIYVPLCTALGFSPLATVSIIGTAGALGDAGSPASDSTLGPTAGLNVDGQHDHIRDTVIPTFLHFNVPLLIAGWLAAMVL